MKRLYVYFILCVVILSCTKDEESNDDIFFSGKDTDVIEEDIIGTWASFAIEFEGENVEVPPNFSDCGRDYLVFGTQGNYTDFVYDKDCIPKVSNANWKLEAGVIVLSDSSGESEKIPVLDASSSELVLKYRFDLNNDGTLDIFKAFLRPYDPIANNHIANSFRRDLEQPTLLQFNWKLFPESENFGRYEIYRAPEGDCSKENAELVATVDEISTTSFVDYNPPETQENICYFLKVFSKNGLVGESELLSEDPKEIIIDQAVILDSPDVQNNSIQLNWSSVNMPYFSHYEIVYANSDGSNLLFHEETSIISIDDMDQNSFLDSDPPFLENPYYSVHAYNIFGTKITSNYEGIIFRRKELLGPINLHAILHDPSDSILYFYGKSMVPEWAMYDEQAVVRYNYLTGEVDSYTDSGASFGNESTIKLIVSPEGKEIISGPEHFYDPITLSQIFSFNSFYLFEQFGVLHPADFVYTKNGFWVIIDSDNVFVFNRNGQELNLIDKQIHFTEHHGDNYYRMMNINDNQILVGHKEENESILFTLNENGEIINKTSVSISMASNYVPIYRNRNVSFYSNSNDVLINYADKTLYSTLTFEVQTEISQDFFALGLSMDGRYVFGSENDPNWFGSDIQTEFLKREAVIFDTASNQITTVKTRGYPIRIFENLQGEIMCISVPENQMPIEFDVFVEKVEIP